MAQLLVPKWPISREGIRPNIRPNIRSIPAEYSVSADTSFTPIGRSLKNIKVFALLFDHGAQHFKNWCFLNHPNTPSKWFYQWPQSPKVGIILEFLKTAKNLLLTLFTILLITAKWAILGGKSPIEWKFTKFSSFWVPGTCLEWIGSSSFSQKNDFYSVKIEHIFRTENWFDGKSWQNSYIVIS